MKVLILAAGASSRTAPIDKLTRHNSIITTTCKSYLSANIGDIHVVIGGNHAQARTKAIENLPVAIHHFSDAHLGMGASLAFGAEMIEDDDLMITLADMPDIKSETIKTLARAHIDGTITAPLCNGKRGHPVIFSAMHLPELRLLTGDKGAQKVIEKYKGDLVVIETSDEGVLTDYDTISSK